MFLRFFKEREQIVCVFSEAFSGGFILLELEMKSFLPIISKPFFRGTEFVHYLRMFSRFFAGPRYYQEILFHQCHLFPSLFQLSLARTF